MARETAESTNPSMSTYNCTFELHDNRDPSNAREYKEDYDLWRKWAASGSPDLALNHVALRLDLDMCQHFDITTRWGRGGPHVKFQGVEQLVQRMLDATNTGMLFLPTTPLLQPPCAQPAFTARHPRRQHACLGCAMHACNQAPISGGSTISYPTRARVR